MTDGKARDFKILMDMAALINSSLDPQLIMKRSVEAVMGLLDTEAGSLLLIDERQWDLFFEVALGNKGDMLRQFRLKKGEGIAGWVAEHGVPQMVRDVRSDPRFYGDVDKLSGFVTRYMVCVPVRSKGKTLGVLQAINKKKGQFQTPDLDMLVALANQVAIALENALLHSSNLNHLKEIVAKDRQEAIIKARRKGII